MSVVSTKGNKIIYHHKYNSSHVVLSDTQTHSEIITISYPHHGGRILAPGRTRLSPLGPGPQLLLFSQRLPFPLSPFFPFCIIPGGKCQTCPPLKMERKEQSSLTHPSVSLLGVKNCPHLPPVLFTLHQWLEIIQPVRKPKPALSQVSSRGYPKCLFQVVLHVYLTYPSAIKGSSYLLDSLLVLWLCNTTPQLLSSF